MRIRFNIWQLALSLIIVVNSIIEIYSYKSEGTIQRMFIPGSLDGAQADFYYKVYIILLVVGIILLLTSWRKKKKDVKD